ncbi:MAG: GAF domain-containing protein, partial [Candidatus Binatia bacterium]
MGLSDRMAEALQESYQGLERKITERTHDLSALYAALAPLASTDSAQLLQQIVERLKEATGADAALIRILDKETKSLPTPAHVGFSSSYLLSTRDLDEGSAVRTAFASGEPIIAADISKDPRLKGKKQLEAGFRSCAFLPLKVSGEMRGVLHLASRREGHFSVDKADHLLAIARQMGVAMENRELLEETKKRSEEQAALSAVAMAASQSLEVHEMLQRALDKVLEVTGRKRATVRLKDPATGQVVLSAHRGFSQAEIDLLRKGPHQDITEKIFATGHPVVVNDSEKPDDPEYLQTQSIGWIPIKARHSVVGILAVSAARPAPFSQRELDFLTAIGNVIGVALENVRLYENERNQVRSLKLLVGASQKLIERDDIDSLAQDILNTVVTSFGIRLAWIGSAEPGGRVRPLYWAGDVADYLKHVEIRWDDSPLGQGPAGQAIRTGQPVVMDVATDPGFEPWRKPALAHGYREVAAFPLKRGAKPFGHLIVYSGETGFFTPEQVELLQTYANIATGALESARLFEETKRQAEERAALNTIATAVSQSLDVQQILNIAMDKVLEVTGRERGYIRLKDPVTGEITLAAHKGISSRYAEVLIHRRTPGGKTDQVFTIGKPLIVNDPKEAPLKGETRREGQNVMAWIPVNARGKVVGILSVGSTRLIPFSTREVELLQAIGNVIGVALENAWLFQESQQQQEIQRLLKELNQDVAALDIRALFQKVTDKVREFFKVDMSDIRLVEDGGVRRLMGSSGIEPERLYRLDSKRGRTKWIIENRRPLIIADISIENEMPAGETVRGLGIRGYLAVPLLSRSGEVIGILRALTYDPREFSQSEVDLLQQLANGIAIAIENARLLDETQCRAQEQAALSAIAMAASQSLEIDEMLHNALDKVLEVTGRERGYIRLKDPLSKELKLIAHKGISEEHTRMILRGRNQAGKSDHVLATGEALIINKPEEALLREETRREGNSSMAWIPLKAQGKVVGILNVSTARSISFTVREVDLLQAIGNVIGVAVENARLFEESQRQEEIQKLLKELSQDITSLDIDSFFHKVTDKVREFFKVDISDIRLLDSGEIRPPVGASGIESKQLYKLGDLRGRGKWIVENRRAAVIPDTTKEKSIQAGGSTRELDIRGYLAVPLFSRSGEVIGILRALTYEPRDFSQSDVDLLQQLANGTAIALTNARLFEETERRAGEQAAVNAIAMAMTQSLHVDELLQIAIDKVLEVTGRNRGSIKVKDRATGRIVLAAHRGLSQQYVNTIRSHFSPEEKAAEIFDSGEVVIVNDPEKSLFKVSTHEEGLRSLIWVPLKTRGTVVGILNVSTPQ